MTPQFGDDEPEVREIAQRLFPNKPFDHIAKAAGFFGGIDPTFYASGDSLGVYGVSADGRTEMQRAFHSVSTPEGDKTVLEHIAQKVGPEHLGGGAERFAEQLKHLDALGGVDRIRISHASGEPNGAHSGYYTWPRFHFDAPLTDAHWKAISPELQSKIEGKPRTFHTLFTTEGGPQFWKKNGLPIRGMHFDLAPNSEHRRLFGEYLTQRKAATNEKVSGTQPTGTVAGGTPQAGAGATAEGTRYAAGTTRLERIRQRLKAAKYKQEQRFSTVLLPVQGDLRQKVLELANKVPDHLLAGNGRETDPHLTLLYGLHSSDHQPIRDLFSNAEGKIGFRLGKVGVFKNPDFDVLKLEVHSPDAHAANALLKTQPHTSTYPTYNPHLTLAYVKSGEGERLAKELGGLEGHSAESDRAIFSDPNRNHTPIPVGEAVTENPIKYATEQPVAHPSVAGFQLEHALRRAISDPETTSDLKALSHTLLTEGVNRSDAAYGIHDEVEGLPEDHWLRKANYNWSAIPHKLHLDAAVGHAIEAVNRAAAPLNEPLHSDGREAIRHFVENPDDLGLFATNDAGNTAAQEAADLLRGTHSDNDLLDSLDRHYHKRKVAVRKRNGSLKAETEAQMGADPLPAGDPNRYAAESKKAVKYQSPALSDFISAVRQIRSSNQEVRRQIAEQQYKKMGLSALVRDAIADAPHTASANTAQAVEHNGDLDKVRAAAALYAQQTESPQLLLFHEHADGADLLHKFDAEGSAEKLRQQLDATGLYNRTLSPTPTGWSAFFFDPKGQQHQKLLVFTQKAGYNLETSVGTGERVGDGQEAEANKENHSDYRQFIQQYEKQQGIR